MPPGQQFARRVFFIAGVTGLIEIVPLYFLQSQLAKTNPPAINHPEWFYGFLGVAAAFQIVFLILSRNPRRYRLMMIPSMLEKVSYVNASAVLFVAGRLSASMLVGPAIDTVWVILFWIAFVKTGTSGTMRSIESKLRDERLRNSSETDVKN